MDGPSPREALLVGLVIAAFVAGNVFFQGLFLAFPLTCRQWALLFVVSAALLAAILVAIIALLIPRPQRKRESGE